MEHLTAVHRGRDEPYLVRELSIRPSFPHGRLAPQTPVGSMVQCSGGSKLVRVYSIVLGHPNLGTQISIFGTR
jgi:hypothetical protein